MKKLLFFLNIFVVLVACSRLSPEEEALQAAGQAAKTSYEHLFSGRYEQFLDGRVGADSLPDAYRSQLIASYKQFVAQQVDAHGGVSSFVVSRSSFLTDSLSGGQAKADSVLGHVQVFLVVSYADSLQEEIVVPMVECRGEWKMK